MKKALSILSILSIAALAFHSNPSKASPVKEDHSISATVLSDMATPVVLKYAALDEVYFVSAISPASDVMAAPTTVQLPEKVIVNKEPLVPDGRLYLYRHYFNPVDLKKYPEYIADKLSDGFPLPVDRPAR